MPFFPELSYFLNLSIRKGVTSCKSKQKALLRLGIQRLYNKGYVLTGLEELVMKV